MSLLQKIVGGAFLVIIAGVAVMLSQARAHERLGEPGIKSRAIAGEINRELILPDTPPGYTSEIVTNSDSLLRNYLPRDTSFQVRAYRGTNGFFSELSVVLMGADRSSIHNPEICMPSQGWTIDSSQTSVEKIPMNSPRPYDLTVNRLISTKVVQDASGKSQTLRGIYVYWFVDGSHYTEKSWKWKVWFIPRDLVLNGVLERWSYISLFSSCLPGQEAATFEQMKQLIRTVVPQFQLVPRPDSGD